MTTPTVVRYQNKDITIGARIMCEYAPDYPSSWYEGHDDEGTMIPIHVGLVEAAEAGAPLADPFAPRERKERKVSTKKERAIKWVAQLVKEKKTRGEIIKVLAQKLKVSKGTASTYYYGAK